MQLPGRQAINHVGVILVLPQAALRTGRQALPWTQTSFLPLAENIQAGTGNITLFKSDGSIVQAFDVTAMSRFPVLQLRLFQQPI